jgi:poly(A) polymerase
MTRLTGQPWMQSSSVRAVIAALEAEGGAGCARFVGGCVRDALLGRGAEVADVDIATTLTPDRVTAALQAADLKAVPTGVEHGTVTAVAEGRGYEITTLRRDVETDGRRAVVAFTQDWTEDARRRDFRLNALYAAPDGEVFDPTGGGLDDVAARRIVFVGDAQARIREDYLRILRFFRFLARVGDAAQADPAGLAACAALKGGIAGLSGERIAQEMLKLLAAPDPRPAVRLMAQASVLGEALPGVDPTLARFEGLAAVEAAAGGADAALRLAALLAPTRDAVQAAADRLKLANALRDRLVAALPDPARPLAPGLAPEEARAARYRLGAQAFADRVTLAWAADPWGPSAAWRSLLAVADWTPPPFPLTGGDIKGLGVAEGPHVGAVRAAVEAWWVAGDFTATRAQALEQLKTVVRALNQNPP